MALSYVDTDGTLVIPQANAKWTTAPSNSGLATSGVIVLVGEAAQGPAYSEESDITQNYFGPNQLAAVQAKYGSGRLVDAFNIASNPSKDPGVRGSPSSIFMVKTNAGTKASSAMLSTYATLRAKLAGFPGNLIFYVVTSPTGSTRKIVVTRQSTGQSESFTFGGTTVLNVQASAAANLIIGTTDVKSSGITTVSLATFEAGMTVTVIDNGVTTVFTGTDTPVLATDVDTSGTQDQTATSLAAKISAVRTGYLTAAAVAAVVTIKATNGTPLAAPTVSAGGTSAQTVAPFIAPFSQFATLGDLVAFMASKTGWTATTTAAYKQLNPSVLDDGTTADVSVATAIKKDAYDFNTAIASSALVEVTSAPVTGLPTNTVLPTFLTGGIKGGTTEAVVVTALAAAEQIRCNAVVTLFSQDAATDLAASLTESSSTYTIAGVNTALTDHVSRMSQFKRRRPRQAFCSFRGTFANAKLAAQTQAYFRTSMAFEDVAALSVAGGVSWFQPYMGAVLAAGMQMAAFYKPIFNKAIACSGVVQNAADFNPGDDSAVEDALLAGLLVIRARDDGAMTFVSDQTTYSADQNFIYNSIQAIYVADTIGMTVALRMEKAFVGQSFADVTAAAAMSYLKAIFADLKRLKLIAGSDDAVDGYKNAKIEISAPSMLVSAEVKEATGLYFIPISFLITQVQQTATA
jgi:hypothetical protein